MQGYDLFMLAVLVGAALFGAVKGLAWQIASLASIFASYFVSYQFRDQLAQQINAQPPWNMFLAMLILFLGTSLVIWIGFRMVANFIDRMKLREFDRQAGALLGLAKGGLLCIIVTFFAVTLLGDNQRRSIVQSYSGKYIAKFLHDADPVMPPEVKGVLGPYINTLDKELDPRNLPPNEETGTAENRVPFNSDSPGGQLLNDAERWSENLGRFSRPSTNSR
jgi:membrane protein required for colicin V production